MENINVYKKLELAKRDIHNTQIKKDKAGYQFKYMDLTSILPIIDEICDKHQLSVTTQFDYVGETSNQIAITKVVDLEKGEVIEFKTPVDLFIKTLTKDTTQNIGANITYYRRYMLFLVFEIIESDAIDGAEKQDLRAYAKTTPKPKQAPPKNFKEETCPERDALVKFLEQNNIPMSDVAKQYGINKNSTPEQFKNTLESLKREQELANDNSVEQIKNILGGDNE